MNLAEIKERESRLNKETWYFDGSDVCESKYGNSIAYEDDTGFTHVSHNVGEFIAHARQDVPALIAEVERLQTIESKSAVIIKNLYTHLLEIYKMRYNVSSDNNYKKIMETARQALEGEED